MLDREYEWASFVAFKQFDKRSFYGACYGNTICNKIAIDFFDMYNAGGEL